MKTYRVNESSHVRAWEVVRPHLMAGEVRSIELHPPVEPSQTFGEEYSEYQQGFDVRESYADAVDWFMRLLHLHGHMNSVLEGMVLDIGCGPGWLQRAFREEVGEWPRTLGIEVNAAALKHNPYPSMLFDGRNLPFPDDAFEAAISMTVLEHLDLDHIAKLVHETMRVAPISVHSLEPDGPTFDNDPTHTTRMDPDGWLGFFRGLGYHVDYIDVGLEWVATYVIRRKQP